MKRLLLILAVLSLTTAAFAGNGRIQRNSRPIPNQYIVVLNEQGERTEQFSNEMARGQKGRVLAQYRKAVKGFALELTEAGALALSRDPRILWVEEDAKLSVLQDAGTWGLDRLDQAELPLDLRYGYTHAGSGVTAYVIDTGIRASHADFGGRVAPGFSAVDDDLGTEDCNGHGTHVASIIGGGLYGVAKNVTLVPVRVFGCGGSGSLSSVLAGIDWIASNHVTGQAAVANMSLGGAASSTLDAAVEASIGRGVTFVVAAGNEGGDACNVSPARLPAAITVGATNWTDARPSWSNQGSCVDLFAPGSAITGAWHTADTAITRMSGTSMAAPHAAGAAAIYLEMNPTASPAAVESMLRTSASAGKISGISPQSVNLLLQTLLTGSTQGGGSSGGSGTTQELDSGNFGTMGPLEPGVACIPSDPITCYSIVEP